MRHGRNIDHTRSWSLLIKRLAGELGIRMEAEWTQTRRKYDLKSWKKLVGEKKMTQVVGTPLHFEAILRRRGWLCDNGGCFETDGGRG